MADSLKNLFGKYDWTTDMKIFVAGFIWLNEKCIFGKEFLELISRHTQRFDDFKKLAGQLNGHYSVFVEMPAEKWAVCSHTWSFPLFYRNTGNAIHISDNPEKLLNEESKLQSSSLSRNYFLTFGVTPANTTLIQNIFQILPGELIRFRGDKKESFRLFPYTEKYRKEDEKSFDEKEFYNLLFEVFQRYSNHIKEKQVLLPLTRGYDSRVLGCLLKEFGHRRVICATWGRNRNNEVRTAEKVAERLGYKHFFIDYSKEVPKDFTRVKEFEPYIHFTGHFSSMPFLQDYFAIKSLKERKIIDSQTVVLPGHPGDLLRGSHLDNHLLLKSEKYAISKIISSFGTSYPLACSEIKELEEFISQTFFSSPQTPAWMQYDEWDYQERQCKFIGNSTLAFSFFETEVLMPMFDMELLKFFRSVPFSLKLGSPLYNQTLETIFEKHKVAFDLKIPQTDGQKFSPLKNIILRNTPHFLKKRYYPMEDSIYYQEITREIRNSDKTFGYKIPFKPNNYNSYIIQWYLQFVGQQISAKK